MKFIRIGIFAVVLLSSKLSFGQLGLSLLAVPSSYFIDTAVYQNTYIHYHLTYTAVQIGPIPSTGGGNLGVGIFVDTTGSGGMGPIIQQDTTASSVYSNLGPGISVIQTDSSLVKPQLYRTGINTVVIWPRLPGYNYLPALDTLRQNILILGYLGINNTITTDKIVLYPNPFSSVIWIKNSTENFVERVRVFDVLGQEIISKEMHNNNKLDLTNLLPGVYFVHLQTKDGKLTIIKTIKE